MYSNKPYSTTLRDSAIAASVSLMIIVIIMFAYYHITETPEEKRDWKGIIIRSVITTVSTQFVYEYLGVNNMLAESSMRYARGSTLIKYTSRKSAMIHEVYYNTLTQIADGAISDPPTREVIDTRFYTMKYLVDNPKIRGKLSNANAGVPIKSKIPEEYRETISDMITRGCNLDTFIDRLTEQQIKDVLLHGFSI